MVLDHTGHLFQTLMENIVGNGALFILLSKLHPLSIKYNGYDEFQSRNSIKYAPMGQSNATWNWRTEKQNPYSGNTAS